MISRIQWLVLLLFYLLYLLVGSGVFLLLEAENEKQNIKQDQEQLRNIQLTSSDLLNKLDDNQTKSDWKKLLNDIGGYCDATFINSADLQRLISLVKNKYNISDNGRHAKEIVIEPLVISDGDNEPEVKKPVEDHMVWTLWNSFFFTFACITTIGYGNMSPSTEGGQIFSIFYSLIGVPLNAILFSGLAELFSSKLVKKQSKPGRYSNKLLLLADAIWYLIPGLVLLMMLPAAVFCYMEGWTYVQSFYFAFISLTTIGFGDFVAGRADLDYGPTIDGIYKGGIFIWTVFGLGYLLMVVGVVQKGLRSQEIRKMDRKMAKVLKERTENINVRGDLGRMRRILDTINVLQLRHALFNNNYAITRQNRSETTGSPATITEVYKEEVKKTSSESDLLAAKQNNHQNNVNIFMDMAETILQRQGTEDQGKDDSLNEVITSSLPSIDSGPTSTHSDPYPAGIINADKIGLENSSGNDKLKNKSDSHLDMTKNVGKRSKKHGKVDQIKISDFSYTNKAFEEEEEIVEKPHRERKQSRKDSLSTSNDKDVEGAAGKLSSHRERFNEKLTKFKNYILNRDEGSRLSDDESSDSEIDSDNHTGTMFTLSQLLGEIEKLVIGEIHNIESSNELKRTLSVPLKARCDSKNRGKAIPGIEEPTDSPVDETDDDSANVNGTNNKVTKRRWSLASIVPSTSVGTSKSHPPIILHSISEPAPSTITNDS